MSIQIGNVAIFNCHEGFAVKVTIIGKRDGGCPWKIRYADGTDQETWAFDSELEVVEMTRDDVVRATADHIRRVGKYMARCSGELATRAVVHDASKWSEDEWPAFAEATPQLAGLTYGSDGYKAALAKIRPAITAHYRGNTHHPEHFTTTCAQCGNDEGNPCTCGGPRLAGGVNGMTLLDLVEMLCDWKAAGERHADGCIRKSIKHNTERFGLTPQLVAILENTASAMGWIEPPQSGGAA